MGAHTNLPIACTQLSGETSLICLVIFFTGIVTPHGTYFAKNFQQLLLHFVLVFFYFIYHILKSAQHLL